MSHIYIQEGGVGSSVRVDGKKRQKKSRKVQERRNESSTGTNVSRSSYLTYKCLIASKLICQVK